MYIPTHSGAPVVSVVAQRSPGAWGVTMKVGRHEKLCGKSLKGIMEIVHQALSQSL